MKEACLKPNIGFQLQSFLAKTLFYMFIIVKQSVFEIDLWHSWCRVKVVCHKDKRSFICALKNYKSNLYSSYQSSKSNLLIYTGPSPVYNLSVRNSLFCSLCLGSNLYRKKHINSLHVFKTVNYFRYVKQFSNVTKFLLGQPIGHLKGAPRKDRGHEDRFKFNLS